MSLQGRKFLYFPAKVYGLNDTVRWGWLEYVYYRAAFCGAEYMGDTCYEYPAWLIAGVEYGREPAKTPFEQYREAELKRLYEEEKEFHLAKARKEKEEFDAFIKMKREGRTL